MAKFTRPLALTAVLAATAIPAIAQPQRINCGFAKTSVEKTICASPQLTALDTRMTNLYFRLRAEASRPGARALLESQVAWLKNLSACGYDANCLVGMYETRNRHFLRYAWYNRVTADHCGPFAPLCAPHTVVQSAVETDSKELASSRLRRNAIGATM